MYIPFSIVACATDSQISLFFFVYLLPLSLSFAMKIHFNQSIVNKFFPCYFSSVLYLYLFCEPYRLNTKYVLLWFDGLYERWKSGDKWFCIITLYVLFVWYRIIYWICVHFWLLCCWDCHEKLIAAINYVNLYSFIENKSTPLCSVTELYYVRYCC